MVKLFFTISTISLLILLQSFVAGNEGLATIYFIHNHPGDTSIRWSSELRLKFEDFKQPKNDSILKKLWRHGKWDTAKFGPPLAYIDCQISFKLKVEKNKTSMEVFAIFFPHNSYMGKYDPNTLAHEQGHFDITEMYARKLGKIMQAYQETEWPAYWNIFSREQKVINGQLDNAHDDFDAATIMSGHVGIKLYLEKIAAMLNEEAGQ